MENILALAIGYLLGSIPFGLIFARLAGFGDIRQIGSGNIGATNVLRTGRKGLALATLLADAGKAAAAVFIARQWGEAAGLLAGFGAFLGHLFPVWLQFKGGKGVATYIGVLTAAQIWGAALFAGLWLAVAAVTRFSSLAALTAAFLTPIALWLMGETETAAVIALMSVLLYIRHKANIARLLKGEEPRIGEKPHIPG